MQDKDTIDFNKIDIVKPTPKQLCMRTHGEYAYCKCNAPHPSATPSDWSSKDGDGDKAKAREQHPLLNFKLLEQQIQKTLQDRVKDIPQDMTHDIMADKQETQNSTDVPAPLPDVPEVNCKGEDITNEPTTTPTYEMTHQEIQLEQEEEKFGIYMSTFGYEGDSSDVDSKMDSDSNVMAYLYLE